MPSTISCIDNPIDSEFDNRFLHFKDIGCFYRCYCERNLVDYIIAYLSDWLIRMLPVSKRKGGGLVCHSRSHG